MVIIIIIIIIRWRSSLLSNDVLYVFYYHIYIIVYNHKMQRVWTVHDVICWLHFDFFMMSLFLKQCVCKKSDPNALFPLCAHVQALTDSRGHDEVGGRLQPERSSYEDHLLQGNPLPHLWTHVCLSLDTPDSMLLLEEQCNFNLSDCNTREWFTT